MSFQIRSLVEGRVCEVTPPATTTSAILQEYDVNMLCLECDLRADVTYSAGVGEGGRGWASGY